MKIKGLGDGYLQSMFECLGAEINIGIVVSISCSGGVIVGTRGAGGVKEERRGCTRAEEARTGGGRPLGLLPRVECACYIGGVDAEGNVADMLRCDTVWGSL
jgi:hypothetical protein